MKPFKGQFQNLKKSQAVYDVPQWLTCLSICLKVILGMYSSFGVLTNLEVKRTYFDQVYILILQNPEYIEGGAGVM